MPGTVCVALGCGVYAPLGLALDFGATGKSAKNPLSAFGVARVLPVPLSPDPGGAVDPPE
jgi:hypothetical protein